MITVSTLRMEAGGRQWSRWRQGVCRTQVKVLPTATSLQFSVITEWPGQPTCCPDDHLSTQTLNRIKWSSGGQRESSKNGTTMEHFPVLLMGWGQPTGPITKAFLGQVWKRRLLAQLIMTERHGLSWYCRKIKEKMWKNNEVKIKRCQIRPISCVCVSFSHPFHFLLKESLMWVRIIKNMSGLESIKYNISLIFVYHR